jgi:RNA polymerase sigma-70 factor (ECF subfamily)
VSPVGASGGDVLLMEVDERSDEAVYSAHAAELVQFAAGVVGPSDAADVVADAFLRLVGSPVWSQARDRRALWIRAVVFEARSLQRSSARRRDREVRVAAGSSQVSPPPSIEDDAVRTALEKLSPQQRAVVVLTYWRDLDPAGVADLLDIGEGAVRKQLARARHKLQEELS